MIKKWQSNKSSIKEKEKRKRKSEFPSYTGGEECERPKQNFLSYWSDILNYGYY